MSLALSVRHMHTIAFRDLDEFASQNTPEAQNLFDLAVREFTLRYLHRIQNDNEPTAFLPIHLPPKIGIIPGTLSFCNPQTWQTDVVAACNLIGIERLNLGPCQEVHVRPFIGKMPHLKRIRIQAEFSDSELMKEFLANCPRLEVLCFDSFSMNNNLSELLEWATTIKELAIGRINLSLTDLSMLRKRVRNGTLVTLDLTECRILSRIRWYQLLDDCKHTLQNLALNGVELTQYHKDQLQLIIKCTKLRRLFLNDARRLTDSMLQELLQNNQDLQELDLGWAYDLTDALFNVLKEHGRSLKRVIIMQSRATLEAYNSFSAEFEKSPNFQYLIMDRCSSIKEGYAHDMKVTRTHLRYWA